MSDYRDLYDVGYDAGYESGYSKGLMEANRNLVRILSSLLLDNTLGLEECRASIQKELRAALDAWDGS